ncbi:MAG: hypothetical protein BWK79_19920 [Beggiatoa sp. IS2]|nr:MAG: hypothetical protein BWK79_19920 [Beggiatoa sp. IS2]
MTTIPWMIYGAYGYTGTLIAVAAKKQGLTPILAGRREDKLTPLAQALELPYQVFDLNNIQQIATQLKEVKLVLHCAGPFSETCSPMVQACLLSHSHYLDITGEIAVFEYIYRLRTQAKEKNLVLCPGVGFDVVPTDCLAATLKAALPNATSLLLAFDSNSPLSAGTLKTTIEGLKAGGQVRKRGMITQVPFAYKIREIPFGDRIKTAITIPWGDIATAYYTTGIPNIEVYMPLPENYIKLFKLLNYLKFLFKSSIVQRLLKQSITHRSGPSVEERAITKTYLWGEVKNAQGEERQASLTIGNAYEVTAQSALGIVKKLLTEQNTPGGFYTPSQLMGNHYITTLPGSSQIIL